MKLFDIITLYFLVSNSAFGHMAMPDYQEITKVKYLFQQEFKKNGLVVDSWDDFTKYYGYGPEVLGDFSNHYEFVDIQTSQYKIVFCGKRRLPTKLVGLKGFFFWGNPEIRSIVMDGETGSFRIKRFSDDIILDSIESKFSNSSGFPRWYLAHKKIMIVFRASTALLIAFVLWWIAMKVKHQRLLVQRDAGG